VEGEVVSAQQEFSENSDLVLLGAVKTGGEVIACGSIFAYKVVQGTKSLFSENSCCADTTSPSTILGRRYSLSGIGFSCSLGLAPSGSFGGTTTLFLLQALISNLMLYQLNYSRIR
jgi:hypothetical protein